jgi:serine/threonine-protein kinase RsbW
MLRTLAAGIRRPAKPAPASRRSSGSDGKIGPVVEDGPALMSRAFDLGDVTALRHAVSRQAAAAGLAGQRLHDFVLAINELITNAVRHGGGRGHLRLWCRDGVVWGEVSDRGPGMSDADDGRRLPPPSSVGGRGLWLAHSMSDKVTIDTGPWGTTATVSASLPR